MGGYFESAAFKSQAMQLDVGAASPQILRFDPKALKVIDAGVEKKPDFLKDAKKRHEVQVTYVEKDGVKVASEIRFKGPAKIDPANLIDYAGVAKLVAEGPAKTPYTLIDSRPLPRFQEGAIPTAIHLPVHRLRQVRRPAAQGQEPAHRLLLRRHHVHAEPELAEEGEATGLYEPARLPRRPARVGHAQLPGDDAGVREGRLSRPRHPARHDRRAHRERRHQRPHQGCGVGAGRSGEGGAQVAARAQAQGAADRLRRSWRRPGRGRGAGPGQGRSAERAGAQRRHDRLAGGELCGGVRRAGADQDRLRAQAACRLAARWPSSPRWPRTRRPTC